MGRNSNAKVVLRDGESLDSALSRFNRKLALSGNLEQVMDRRYHMSKRERREAKAKRNNK